MTGPLAVETRRCQATRARGSSARRIHGGPPQLADRWNSANIRMRISSAPGATPLYECASPEARELRRCTNALFLHPTTAAPLPAHPRSTNRRRCPQNRGSRPAAAAPPQDLTLDGGEVRQVDRRRAASAG